MRQGIKNTKTEVITIPLDDFLGLELECFYDYEPAVPEDDINPPEQAVVELQEVYLGDAVLKYDFHLNHKQWVRLEQEIYNRLEQE